MQKQMLSASRHHSSGTGYPPLSADCRHEGGVSCTRMIRGFMAAVSVTAVLAGAGGGFYGGRARAQTVPAGDCTSTVVDGKNIWTCTGIIESGKDFAETGQTVNVGTSEDPGFIYNYQATVYNGTGITLTETGGPAGDGVSRLTVNENSAVYGYNRAVSLYAEGEGSVYADIYGTLKTYTQINSTDSDQDPSGDRGLYISQTGTNSLVRVSVSRIDTAGTGIYVVQQEASGGREGDDRIGNVEISTHNLVDENGEYHGIKAGNKGIYVTRNATNDGDITITTYGRVFGKNGGIDVSQAEGGSGDITITTGVKSAVGNSMADEDLEVAADTATSGSGIEVDNGGTGAVTVDVQGNVTGGGRGIYVNSQGSLSVTTAAGTTVTGTGSRGISAFGNGAGTVTVDVHGTVNGGGIGVFAGLGSSGEGDLAVSTSAGSTVTGVFEGISVVDDSTGDGDLTVDAAGSVTGGTYGILVGRNESGASSILVKTADSAIVTGQEDNGIMVSNRGTGTLTVESAGHVEGGYSGISVWQTNSSGGAVKVTTSAGSTVSGEKNAGIYALNDGTGTLTVDVAGDVTGKTIGIDVLQRNADAGDVDVTTFAGSTVTGQEDAGIRAYNYGSGNLTVAVGKSIDDGSATQTGGTSTGAGYDDIYAAGHGIHASNGEKNVPGGADLSVTTYAGSRIESRLKNGIYAENHGSGALAVTVGGYVKGYSLGVEAGSTGGDLSITTLAGSYVGATASAGNSFGIGAQNYGTGDLTVNIGGDVRSAGDAVAVRNGDADSVSLAETVGGLSITTYAGASIDSSARAGIHAYNYGTGALTVAVGKSTDDDAAEPARSAFPVGDTDDIHADRHGVHAVNGSMDASAGTDLSVTTYADSSIKSIEGHGVYLKNFGTGALTVDASGDIEGYDDGIHVIQSSFSAADVTITTVDGAEISGHDSDGISAFSTGGGSVAVDISGDVTGAEKGIYVNQASYGGKSVSVAISADSTVTGGSYGIYAKNAGEGVLTIDVAGKVYADGHGIYANHRMERSDDSSDTDVSSDQLEAFSISARPGGLLPQHEYERNMKITVTGTVKGGYGDNALAGVNGIRAKHNSTGYLHVYAHNVSGSENAISAYGDPHGTEVRITTTGEITGGTGSGITVENGGSGPVVIIVEEGSVVTGGKTGIYAYQNNDNAGVDITVAGEVTGGSEQGIYASVDSTGVEEGGPVKALFASVDSTGVEEGGPVSRISVEDGGKIIARAYAAPSGNDYSTTAVRNGAGRMELTLEAGGEIAGDVLMEDGDDAFHDGSGNFTFVDGGEGDEDTVYFSGQGRIFEAGDVSEGNDGDRLDGFEIFVFNEGGMTVAGNNTVSGLVRFETGVTVLSGNGTTLVADSTVIAEGAGLNMQDGTVLDSDLVNAGTLDIGSSPGSASVNGNFTMEETGIFLVDVGAQGHDTLAVSGDVSLGGTLRLVSGTLSPESSYEIVSFAGDVAADTAFGEIDGADGLLYSYDVAVADGSVIVTGGFNDIASVEGLNGNMQSVARYLVAVPGTDGDYDADFQSLVNAVLLIEDEDVLAGALEQMTPAGFETGLRMMASAQAHFSGMTGQHAGDGTGKGARMWLSGRGLYEKTDGGGEIPAYDGHMYILATGVSGIPLGPFDAGLAAAYTRFSGKQEGRPGDRNDGRLYHIAGSLGADFMLGKIGGRIDNIVSYAGGDSTLAMRLRNPAAPRRPVMQGGKTDISSLEWRTRLTMDAWSDAKGSLKPFAEAGYALIRQDGVTIGHGGATTLVLEDTESLRGEVALGADASYMIGKGITLGAGVTGLWYFGDTQNVFESHFYSIAGELEPFMTYGQDIDWQVDVRSSVSWQHESGIVLSAEGFGQVGDIYLYGGGMRFSQRF